MPDPPKTPISMPLSTPNGMLLEMPPVRKRLIVEGRVQGVGYRALVTFHARNLKIKGVVRNLPDETVEVICEADNGTLKEFLKAIDQKGDPADNTSLHVASIKEALPAPGGELGRFYTDYGRKLTELERESMDREEMMVLKAGTLNINMGALGQKFDGLGQKFDGLGQKFDGVGKDIREVGQKVDGVGTAVRDMHAGVNTRFDHMAEHYDMIALSLKEAIDHMDRNAEKTDRAIEKSRKETVTAIKKSEERTARYITETNRKTALENRKYHKETARMLTESRKEAAAANRELAGAVKFMIRKLSDRPARKRQAAKRKRKR